MLEGISRCVAEHSATFDATVATVTVNETVGVSSGASSSIFTVSSSSPIVTVSSSSPIFTVSSSSPIVTVSFFLYRARGERALITYVIEAVRDMSNEILRTEKDMSTHKK